MILESKTVGKNIHYFISGQIKISKWQKYSSLLHNVIKETPTPPGGICHHAIRTGTSSRLNPQGSH